MVYSDGGDCYWVGEKTNLLMIRLNKVCPAEIKIRKEEIRSSSSSYHHHDCHYHNSSSTKPTFHQDTRSAPHYHQNRSPWHRFKVAENNGFFKGFAPWSFCGHFWGNQPPTSNTPGEKDQTKPQNSVGWKNSQLAKSKNKLILGLYKFTYIIPTPFQTKNSTDYPHAARSMMHVTNSPLVLFSSGLWQLSLVGCCFFLWENTKCPSKLPFSKHRIHIWVYLQLTEH